MSENSDQNQAVDEKKPGGTLDLDNISINTLKDDLAGEAGGEAQEDKSGWFSFLAKHKKEEPAAAANESQEATQAPGAITESEPVPDPSPLPGSEPAGGSLEQALDEFKTESEEKASPAAAGASAGAEAPPNLPVSDGNISPAPGSAPETPAAETPAPEAAAEAGTTESPALGSFFPPKEETPEEPEETPSLTHLAPPVKPASENGDGDKVPVEKEENKNPFSSRIQPVESEKKSLLQSVESALNYSAPPEFSEERGKQAVPPEEGGKVVDLREKSPGKPGGLLQNKKLLIIIGGAGGFVVIVIIILAMSLGGSSKKPVAANANLNTNQANKNQNANPVAQLNTNVAVPKPAVLAAPKFLANVQEKNVASVNAISQEIQNLREGTAVSKQTQLVFLKPDGSAVSFQDLTNATGMNIPQKIISQPSSAPALIFADFFRGQTILGLVIPTSDSPETALSKMQDWENTMVLDLDYLWEGIDIDNKGAYFADSQLFKNARFALIDKRDKLSLDYAVDNGYILITCGRDSMTILKNNFIAPSSGSSGSNGIQWEGSESMTASGATPGADQ